MYHFPLHDRVIKRAEIWQLYTMEFDDIGYIGLNDKWISKIKGLKVPKGHSTQLALPNILGKTERIFYNAV